MDRQGIMEAYGALAQTTRMRIFELVVGAAEAGVTAGTIARALQLPPSHLTKHLDILVRARVIDRSDQGRFAVFTSNDATVASMAEYLGRHLRAG